MSNPCELDVFIETPNTVPAVLRIPPGDYSGIEAYAQWDDGTTAEVILGVQDEFTTIDEDIHSGVSSGVDLSLGPFTITGDFGRVTLTVDWFPNLASHTINTATVITITKTA